MTMKRKVESYFSHQTERTISFFFFYIKRSNFSDVEKRDVNQRMWLITILLSHDGIFSHLFTGRRGRCVSLWFRWPSKESSVSSDPLARDLFGVPRAWTIVEERFRSSAQLRMCNTTDRSERISRTDGTESSWATDLRAHVPAPTHAFETHACTHERCIHVVS